MKKPEYTWDPGLGFASCTLYYKNLEFYGSAHCHRDDEEARATIEYLTHIRDNEVRPQLKSLYQLYYSMKHSSKFNPKSYESIMLYRQIHHLEKDLDAVSKEIVNIKQMLKEYIEQKEKDHQKIREYHSKKQLDENNQ